MYCERNKNNMWILSIASSIIVFVAVLLAFALRQRKKHTGMEYLLIVASASGLIIYGYGFYSVEKNLPLSVIRTVLATFNMFLGGNSYSAIQGASFMRNDAVLCGFWMTHILALFVTANAVISTIGAKAFRKIRRALTWMTDKVIVIYGSNTQCIEFAQKLEENIIIIDDGLSEERRMLIEANGWTAISRDREKIVGAILRKVNIVKLYCLRNEEERNTAFAWEFLNLTESQRKAGKIRKITVTILANMAAVDGSDFQKTEGHDGYDSVLIVDKAYMVAKTLVSHMPPCKAIDFSCNYTADHDFRVAIIGFGRIGQEVLKGLYINGQFLGSKFKATIFDRNYSNEAAFLTQMNPEMYDNFLDPEINGFETEAAGNQFYDRLREFCPDYVCICTGDGLKNRRIANEVKSFLKRNHVASSICECTYDSVDIHMRNGKIEKKETFVPDMLDSEKVDRIAMAINYAYLTDVDKESVSKETAWERLSYFNRMSCRSVADFVPTYEYIVSQNSGVWDLEELSKIEHLRWSAFYFANGYRCMSEEMFMERSNNYIRGVKGIDHRFQKDELKSLTHACLIPWDRLSELDRKQNAAFERRGETRRVDYKKNDRNNVELIKDMIQSGLGDK